MSKKREDLEADFEKKGVTNFHLGEILLDIRDLLEKLVDSKKDKKN